MKFLIVMLVIRLVASAAKNREKKETMPAATRGFIKDPAEFQIRD